ncbi:hypothetical protein X771_09355 [Mesorhizobium sp. LSJC277A00]|nr:hypothetical protein X771_09355 [Mesorhizobium sp. LSJC277A00]
MAYFFDVAVLPPAATGLSGSPFRRNVEPLYSFTQFRTENRFTLFLELLLQNR